MDGRMSGLIRGVGDGRAQKGPERAVFIHVPKTAGSSLIYAMRRIYGHKKVWVRKGFNWPMDLPAKVPPTASAWAGHMSYGLHEVLPCSVQYIVLLRHPLERLRSAYRYLLGRRQNPLFRSVQEVDEVAFCFGRPIVPEFDNGQLRRLLPNGQDIPIGHCTPEHLNDVLQRVDEGRLCIGIQERFDLSILQFAVRCNWPTPYYWTQNVSRPLTSGIGANYEVPSSCRLDLALYEKAWERLDQAQFGEACLSPERVERFRRTNRYVYRTAVAFPMAARKVRIIGKRVIDRGGV